MSEGRGSRDVHLPPTVDRSRVAEPRLPRGTARDARPTYLNPRPYGRERGSRDRPLTVRRGVRTRDVALPRRFPSTVALAARSSRMAG